MAKKNSGNGFKVRLAQAIIFTVFALAIWVMWVVFAFILNVVHTEFIAIYGAAMSLLAFINYLFAFRGKKSRAANICCIIFNAPLLFYGLCGIIGGVKGLKALRKKGEKAPLDAESTKTFADFPVDYENKPLVSKMLEFKNIEGTSGDGEDMSFTPVFRTIYRDELYILAVETESLAAPVGSKTWAAFLVDYEHDTFSTVQDDELISKIVDFFNEWAEQHNETLKEVGKFVPQDVLEAFPLDETKPFITDTVYLGKNFSGYDDDGNKCYECRPVQPKIYGEKLYLLAERVETNGQPDSGYTIFCVDFDRDDVYIEPDVELAERIFDEINRDLAEKNSERTEYIQPKTSPKAKKAAMIAVVALYSVLLVVGVLLAAVPSFGNILHSIGICEEISARAYGITLGTLWIALVPSVGYYFATIAPTKLQFKGKVLLAVATTLLLAGFDVLFFVIANAVQIDGLAVKEYYETSDVWFIPATIICSSAGLILSYVMLLLKMNPEKLKAMTMQNGDDGDPTKHAKSFLNSVSSVLTKVLKWLLIFKEKHPELFIVIATVLFTWLAYFVSFIVAIIVGVIFFGVLILLFTGFLDSGIKTEHPQLEVYDGGYRRILTYNGGYNGMDTYKDDTGTIWYRDSDGKVYKE